MQSGSLDEMAAVQAAKVEVAELHAELPRNGLVSWTGGNISARVAGTDLFVIKPSGVRYEDLCPDSMVVCDLNGEVVGGDLQPSSDVLTHAYIYGQMSEVGGVVHTHSPYATAWAAVGQSIPCILTAMADEFGDLSIWSSSNKTSHNIVRLLFVVKCFTEFWVDCIFIYIL